VLLLNLLMACETSNFGEIDFSLVPELQHLPQFDKPVINAGEAFKITFKNKGASFKPYVSFSEYPGSELIFNGPLLHEDENGYLSTTVQTDCSADGGYYYPTIAVDNIAGSAIYIPKLSNDPVYYKVKKKVYDSRHKLRSKTFATDIVAPKLEIKQANQNGTPDLKINIESVIENESTLSINYKLKNDGDRGASSFYLVFWLQKDSMANRENNIASYVDFYPSRCIQPNEEIRSTVIIAKIFNAGIVFGEINLLHPMQKNDQRKNISIGYLWATNR